MSLLELRIHFIVFCEGSEWFGSGRHEWPLFDMSLSNAPCGDPKIRLFFCHESHHSYVMCNKAEEIKITEAKLKWLALVFLHWVVLYVNECFFIQFPKILWVLDFFSMNIIWTILTACLYLYVRTWLCEPIVFCTQILREWSPYDNSFPVFFVKLSFLELCLPNTLTKKSIHMPFLSNN